MKKKNFFDYLDLFFVALVVFICLIPSIFIYIMFATEMETEREIKVATWDDFKSEHNCKIVSIDEGFWGKTGWLCDDNITYYK